MQTQTLFKAGNSDVVAIPKHILKELNLSAGHKVTVNVSPSGDEIVVKADKPTKKTNQKQTKANQEFQKWLDVFFVENGGILDELANR